MHATGITSAWYVHQRSLWSLFSCYCENIRLSWCNLCSNTSLMCLASPHTAFMYVWTCWTITQWRRWHSRHQSPTGYCTTSIHLTKSATGENIHRGIGAQGGRSAVTVGIGASLTAWILCWWLLSFCWIGVVAFSRHSLSKLHPSYVSNCTSLHSQPETIHRNTMVATIYTVIRDNTTCRAASWY